MKISIEQLKRLIQEEYLKGIPEFQLQEATKKYVNEVRLFVRRHIERTYTGDDASYAYERCEEMLKSLEEEANELLESKVIEFTQKI